MTKTELFRKELSDIIDAAINAEGFKKYAKQQILDYLVSLAEESGVTKLDDITPHDLLTWDIRQMKTGSVSPNDEQTSQSATPSTIIAHSVDKIIKTAAIKANEDGNDYLKQTDVEYGFIYNKCKVPPFCKEK